jgi:hypothetical protein
LAVTHYDLRTSGSLEVRLQFQVTGILSAGDSLLFSLPVVEGPTGSMGNITGAVTVKVIAITIVAVITSTLTLILTLPINIKTNSNVTLILT